jgi:hypothetical protein
MVGLALGAYVLVGDDYRRRRGVEARIDLEPDPASAVTGHA